MSSRPTPGLAADELLERLAAKRGLPALAGREPVSRRFPAADGVELHALDWGGDGEPVVFLHGGVLTAHSWDLVALGMRDKFRCVSLDLRGHGESGWSERYSTAVRVGDLEALRSEFGFARCHLAGMSLGGNVAGHYAATHLDRVASLTLVDVGPWVDFAASAPMREFMGRPSGGMTIESLVDAALRVSATADGDTLAYRYTHMTQMQDDGTLSWRHDPKPHDFEHILAKLDELATLAPSMTCPTLLVRGERSRMLTAEKVERFAGLFPNATWTIVPGAGHNVQEDEPLALSIVLGEFLSTHPILKEPE